MNLIVAISEIYEGADFNPAAFNFTEEEARAKKLWRDARPMPTQEELEAAYEVANKPVLITEKYDEMVKDIYDEMLNVFGTKNDVSASAFAATWEAMIKRPGSYVDPTLGLNDEASVLAYANSKLAAADAYGVFRLKRIGQFQAEKAAIENV